MNRRHFLQASAAFATMTFTAHGHSHHHVNEAPFEASQQAPPPTSPVISGSGDFRFEYVPTKLQLPAEVKMRNGHGLCLDTEGNIYFTFEPEKV